MSYQPDQDEVLADIRRLDLKAKYLAVELEMRTGKRVQAPELSRGDILLNLETLKKHCVELETALGQSLDAETARPAAQSGAAELSATEQVLEALRVASVEEARRKRLEVKKPFAARSQTVDPKILNDPNMTATEKCLAVKRQQQNQP